MSITNAERLKRKEADRQFREALIERPAFGYGGTALTEHGGVEVVEEYSTNQGLALVRVVRIVADNITVRAYAGLVVTPVGDDSGLQPPQVMGVSGEVEFSLHVYSVRFSEPES